MDESTYVWHSNLVLPIPDRHPTHPVPSPRGRTGARVSARNSGVRPMERSGRVRAVVIVVVSRGRLRAHRRPADGRGAFTRPKTRAVHTAASRCGEEAPRGTGTPAPSHRPLHSLPRTTATGQPAWYSSAWLTEPSSIPVKPP